MSAGNSQREQSPYLLRRTSTYELKAVYQRNMLIGLAGAVLLFAIPTLVLAFWPTISGDQDSFNDRIPEPPTDTIIISADLSDEYTVVREPGSSVGGRAQSPADMSVGILVEHVEPVPDSLLPLETEREFGRENWGDPWPDRGELWEPGTGTWGGTVLVEDTMVYDASRGQLDRLPELVRMPEPEYPGLARKAGAEGLVVLHVQVNRRGQAEAVTVISDSNPTFGFARAAVAAAHRAVFSPALHKGQAVRCLVALPVEFVIKD